MVFQIGRPVGVHEKLISVISDRGRNTGVMVKAKSPALLVQRGSSDPERKRDLERIAEMIKLSLPFKKVLRECVASITVISPKIHQDNFQLAIEQKQNK